MAYMYNAQGQLIDTTTGQVSNNTENPRNTLAMQAARDNTSIVNNTSGNWTNVATPSVDANTWAGQRLDELNAAAEKYANDLRATAQGDYDFAIKWLTKQHETALGTSDTERAKFFESVANSLEKQIGRIPYDYLTKTDIEKQDIANYMLDQNRAKEDQFQREYQFNQQQDLAVQKETTTRQEGFNARGLAGSGLEKKQQNLDEKTRKINTIDPQQRAFSLEQDQRNASIRNRQLLSERTLADLTTNARRTGEDTQMGFDQGVGQADRSLASRLAEINAQQELLKRQSVQQVGTELGSIYG